MRFEKRPWGWFIKFIALKNFWFKLIRVKRGQRTSLQKHKDRKEIHVGIQFVDKNLPHRIAHGFYIEMAFGKPRENDIVRLKDDYGRLQ